MKPRIFRFLKYNKHKRLTIQVYFYLALYRMCILLFSKHALERFMGIRGEESASEEPEEVLRKAYLIGSVINRVADHTPWESKCLCRALTARKMLMNRGIVSTLYLGVGKDNGKMVAHAWLRCGQLYVTGGKGEGYAMVAKFKSM